MRVPSGWSQADDNVQGTSRGLGNSHPPLEASGWHRVRWLQVGEASSSVGPRRGSSDTASMWAVSVLGVCLPACLPLCCSEGGRGWACSCLGRAAPASCVGHNSSLSGVRFTASFPTHLHSPRGASGQPLLGRLWKSQSLGGAASPLGSV